MNIIGWLLSRVIHFFFGKGEERRSSSVARESEAEAQESRTASRGRNFDDDYRAAMKLLTMRLRNHFP